MNCTKIDDGIYVCDDCGAHAGKPENIEHFDGCEPGGSEKWREFYNDVVEDEE